MWKAFSLAIVLTPLIAGAVCAQDAREPAARTAAERAFILNQMRLFLGSVQTISSALAEGDMQTVATEATARGRRGTPASEIPPTMRAKETAGWTALMSGARQGFDGIADAASSGAPPARILGLMGDTMRNCVACHQSYRLVEE
jgi:hypothetical protein